MDREREILNVRHQELEQCRGDLRVEQDRRSGIAGVGTEGDRDRIQCLYGKYLQADSYRKALVYHKKYLLLLLGDSRTVSSLALIARLEVYPSPEDLQQGIRPRRPVTAFRSAARVVVAVTRSEGQTGHHVQECSIIGSVVVVQPGYLFVFNFPGEIYYNEYFGCYAPNSNSFSPLRINTQSRLNSSGPFNSHASSPLHSSLLCQRQYLCPYHTAHVGLKQQTTPTSENSGARRKILSPSSPNPTKVGHSSLIHRVRIRKVRPMTTTSLDSNRESASET
uniref:Pericentrin/AKAP-450 centrosomal targeting domain-containing protein n=1 Tax=Magallana gigas TaxID=29159 RepID=A0A8W8M7I6_MAGGI